MVAPPFLFSYGLRLNIGCFFLYFCEFQQEAERSILKRGDKQLTSKAGYAGGKASGSEGRVCYHNFQRVADYGSLGHGEVVGMTLPKDQLIPFTNLYFSLYNPKTKGRSPWRQWAIQRASKEKYFFFLTRFVAVFRTINRPR